MLRMIQLMVETDDLLESSWRTRQWATFIRVWLVTSVTMVVVAFLIPFVFIYTPFFIYNVLVSVGAVIFGGSAKPSGPSFSELSRTFALPSGVLVGLCSLIFTVPVMMFKQLSGEFKKRESNYIAQEESAPSQGVPARPAHQRRAKQETSSC
jgi:hypothetical protein